MMHPRITLTLRSLVLISPIAVLVLTGCPVTPPDLGPDSQSGDPIETGKTLYAARRCINCHGSDALGKSTFPGAPRIVGRSAADLRLVVVEPCADPNAVTNC